MITKTKEATSLATHIKNATIIICSILVLTVFWIYLFSSALILEQKNYTTEEYLTQPLINFSLSEKSGTTVTSKGLISGLSAAFEGTKIGWKSIYKTNPDFPKSLTGIIGYWKLDNSLNDSSGKNNQLIARGGISCSGDSGFLNNGCAFGEYGQYLEIENINKLLNPRSGTISVWIYPTGNASNSYVIQGNTADSDRYYIQWTNGRIRIVRGSQNPSIQNSSVATITLLENTELNNWYHVVMSWDESNIYGYVNGIKSNEVGTKYYSPSYSTNTKFRIGNQQSASSTDNRSFLGLIDEVSFFNRKLTDNEIEQIFKEASDATSPIPDSGKYLSFETSGSSAYGRLRINNHSQIQKLNIKDVFTIEADIYLKDYPTDVNRPYTIYTDSSVLSNGNGLAVFPNGRLGVYANTGNTRFIFRAGQVPLNEWVTVKGSFNSKTNEMSVSINEKDFVTTGPDKKTGIAKSFTRPMIGMSGTWNNAFKGYVKNVKLWNNSILNGQYSYGLAEITKAGFDRDLADEPKASWLGSGTLEVLHSEGMPEVGITRREGNLEATSQVSLEEIKQARESAGITSRKFAAWAAWKNANGEVNLAISSPLSEQEVVAIKSLASTTWKVFPVKSFIGPSLVANSWAWKTPYYLSHINMGSSEFQAGLEALKSMRVIGNINKK